MTETPTLSPKKRGRKPEVIQENTDFARVMGFRTREASITWTAHYPLEAGSTRICVYSLSYLHNIPPGFMGGEQRVLREAVVATRELIENVRAFDERSSCELSSRRTPFAPQPPSASCPRE